MKLLLPVSLALLAGLGGCASPPITSPDPDARPTLDHYNVERSTLALEGYDPVSYFAEGGGKPTRGREELAAVYRGVTYRFANEANRERFLASPETYEPAFGGWCAYAMADGEKVEVDVESYLIQDGKLLLFYDGLFGDTRAAWLEEGKAPLLARAMDGWRAVSGEDVGAGSDDSLPDDAE